MLRLRFAFVLSTMWHERNALIVPPFGGSLLYALRSPKSAREAVADYFALRARAEARVRTLSRRIARVEAMAIRTGVHIHPLTRTVFVKVQS